MHTSIVIITHGENTAPLTGILRELDIHMTSERKERKGTMLYPEKKKNQSKIDSLT